MYVVTSWTGLKVTEEAEVFLQLLTASFPRFCPSLAGYRKVPSWVLSFSSSTFETYLPVLLPPRVSLLTTHYSMLLLQPTHFAVSSKRTASDLIFGQTPGTLLSMQRSPPTWGFQPGGQTHPVILCHFKAWLSHWKSQLNILVFCYLHICHGPIM